MAASQLVPIIEYCNFQLILLYRTNFYYNLLVLMMKPFFFINNIDSDYECNFDILGYNQKRFREACFLGGGGIFATGETPRGGEYRVPYCICTQKILNHCCGGTGCKGNIIPDFNFHRFTYRCILLSHG